MLVDSLVNMTLGMILGMAVSPLMMKVFRNVRQTRRVNKILRDISEIKRAS